MAGKLKTQPKYDLLPPLTTNEFAALRADIKANGVRDPIMVDDDGEILDGHHRHSIDKNAPRRTISGMTESEKQAFVFAANFNRRNLSPSQQQDARKKMQAIAKALKKENKSNTQAVIARKLGVSQPTVAGWLVHNIKTDKTHNHDSRVKIPVQANPVIVDRSDAGESQEQIAADYGVNRSQISRIVTKEKKQRTAKKEREKAVVKLKGDDVMIGTGDFRKVGKMVRDNSVDLIFTDPPYDKAAVELYYELAVFAERVLRPGGWCLAYSGQAHLLDVLDRMSRHLSYGWMFACVHKNSSSRFRNLKLQVGWKPILGFYKAPLNAWWDWFADTASGGKEKDHHEWQQAEGEAAHFIEALSPKSGLICDPFCGGGTTPAAAKRCGRNWIAFEIDKDVAEEARLRLAV